MKISSIPRLFVKPTLLLACVFILVLAAAGILSQESAVAHPCGPNIPREAHVDLHEDLHGTRCDAPGHDSPHDVGIRVHGGRDQEIRLNVLPPPRGKDMDLQYLDEVDQIEIKLEGFDLSNPDIEMMTELFRISYEMTEDMNEFEWLAKEVKVDSVMGKLTLTLPGEFKAPDHGQDTHLLIIIEQGTGILAPKIPRGFDEQDDCDDAYEVEITLIDTDSNDGMGEIPSVDENCIVVRNPVSSTVPGAAVRVELHTFSKDEIHSNQEIVVDFFGPADDTSFTTPETISPTNVQIGYKDRTHNPSNVLVQGRRVILTVPTGRWFFAGY